MEYSAGQNVFEGAINAGNVINHVASTILSAAEIDHKGNQYPSSNTPLPPPQSTASARSPPSARRSLRLRDSPPRGPMGTIHKIHHLDEYPEFRAFTSIMDGPLRAGSPLSP